MDWIPNLPLYALRYAYLRKVNTWQSKSPHAHSMPAVLLRKDPHRDSIRAC